MVEEKKEEDLVLKAITDREEVLRRGLLEVEQKINLGNAQMQELGVARLELIGRLKENQEMRKQHENVDAPDEPEPSE